MSTAFELAQEHFATLLKDPEKWKTLISEEVVWELAYAPSIGHPASLRGKTAVEKHAAWFSEAVEDFSFSNLTVYRLTDVDTAVAEVRGYGRVKSTGRTYDQNYLLILGAKNGRISFMREYFDPIRAAVAMDISLDSPGTLSHDL